MHPGDVLSFQAPVGLLPHLSGRRLGSYEVGERIGRSATADVYAARQLPVGREVALKVLTPSPGQEAFMSLLREEARTLAALDHPNILPISDFGVLEGISFLTMPLVRGGSLRDRMKAARLAAPDAWRYLKEIVDALDHAHAAGVLHRNLKPSNVLIHADGRALVSDFGLGRSSEGPTGLTAYRFSIGDPGYMPPEQVMGQRIEASADIYSLGALIFEMLTGTPAFTGSTTVELAMAVVNNPVPSAHARNHALPAALDAVLARAMAKEPADRPASARDLLEEVLTALVDPLESAPNHADASPTLQLYHPVTQEQVENGHNGAAAPVEDEAAPETANSDPESPPTGADEYTPGAHDTWPALNHVVAPRPSRLSEQPAPPRLEEVQLPVTWRRGPTIIVLDEMGITSRRSRREHMVDSYFASLVETAAQVAGDLWPEVATAAGVAEGSATLLKNSDKLSTPVHLVGRLNQGFEEVFGADAPGKIRYWGRMTTINWLGGWKQKNRSLLGEADPEVAMVLSAFVDSLNAARGEELHVWRRISDQQFWVIFYGNPFAYDRAAGGKSCHFWSAALDSLLRWSGLGNDWVVEEVECGSVLGTDDCVFAVRRVQRPGSTEMPRLKKTQRLPLPARRSRFRQALRWLSLGVLASAVLVGAAGVTESAIQQVLNLQDYPVRSHLMEPLLPEGSLLVTSPVPADQVRPGDVIMFQAPDDPTSRVVRRVLSIETAASAAGIPERFLVTQADRNQDLDPWRLPAEGYLQRARADIPIAGYVALVLPDLGDRILCLALPLAAAVVYLAWTRRPRPITLVSHSAPPLIQSS